MSNSFEAPWTVARQAPLSFGFPKQEYFLFCFNLLQSFYFSCGAISCLSSSVVLNFEHFQAYILFFPAVGLVSNVFFFFPNMRIQQSWVAPDQVRMVCSSWLWLLELTFTVTFDFCDFFLFKNFFGLIIPDSLAEERKGILVTFNI